MIKQKVSGTVYGVILNDHRSLQKIGPLDGAPAENVVLAVDEYETIRLIDLLGLTQEECAGQMGVARTTVQALYEAARAGRVDRALQLLEAGADAHARLGGDEQVAAPPGNRLRCLTIFSPPSAGRLPADRPPPLPHSVRNEATVFPLRMED